MAQWHNKHIGTQWGVAILGFLLVATALLIPVLNQQINLRSHASGTDYSGTACSAPGDGTGVCEDRSKAGSCPSHYNSGNYCPGGTNIQCCVLHPYLSSCHTSIGYGVCENRTSASQYKNPPGYFDSGDHCPGTQDIQCYVVSINPKAPAVINSSCEVNHQGFCEIKGNNHHVNGTAGTYHPEFICPGPANVQCWVPYPAHHDFTQGSVSTATPTPTPYKTAPPMIHAE